MNALILVPVSIFLSMLLSCSKAEDNNLPGEPVSIELSPDKIKLINNTNDFAFNLFRRVNSGSASENIIISPLSVSSALSMTLNGASGETRDSILKALCLDDLGVEAINSSYSDLVKALTSVDRRVAISVANSVWTEKQFKAKQQFIEVINKFYDAETEEFDKNNPEAADDINAWIENNTNGIIKQMLDGIDPDAAMLLINAIYFKGQWKYAFDKNLTTDGDFRLTDETIARVSMMRQSLKLNTAQGNGFKMVELPYGQGNFVMDVLLPDDSSNINDIIKNLTSNDYNSLVSLGSISTVELSMPKFKYSYKKTLNEILESMGMGIAFSDEADFTAIADAPLAISRVLHQAFIETNEEGTEAAAATIVEIVLTSLPQSEIINIDRPFIYFIREKSTNAIVFMGKVVDPREI